MQRRQGNDGNNHNQTVSNEDDGNNHNETVSNSIPDPPDSTPPPPDPVQQTVEESIRQSSAFLEQQGM